MNNRLLERNGGRIWKMLPWMRACILVAGLASLLIACEARTEAVYSAPECECWLDELTSSDTLVLTVTSAGCFHHHLEQIKIYKGADSLEAAFTACLPNSNGVVGPIVRPFSGEAKLILADLMKTGASLKTQNQCTTVDSYFVQFRNDLLSFVDGDCELQEYQALKASLLTDEDAQQLHFGVNALKRKRLEVD